ncbi:hypothetical protein NUH88_05055 [Nisaea acidiphila]|uniref:Cupin n=1 Tax=Nisaea acidiphila TaxID=1862145 RepID=A0A9J7B042_9PROT|nr:hypothetical protein [Nisaea acidiphila]UUX51061.1 hypothetical protein NUH88_05055 [Nisaea acidiphila]
MTVFNYDSEQGHGVAISSPNIKGHIVVLPEKGDATDWHKYGAGETYVVTAMTRFPFRREVRREDGTVEVEEYDLAAGSTIKRSGPFEHRVINLSDETVVFGKRS